jgi:hypothetical protein
VDTDCNQRFLSQKHPFNWEFIHQEKSLEWLLDKNWTDFLIFMYETNLEYLDLLLQDITSEKGNKKWVVDGGELAIPSLFVQMVPKEKLRMKIWEDRLWARVIKNGFSKP